MYHYIDDKTFLKRMRSLCSDIINQLVQYINNDDVMDVEAHLIGSGARNLITQNENLPIDLDYNLNIISLYEYDWNGSEREIKEYIRKAFNVVLNRNEWSDCKDSTSVLTTERRHFTNGNPTEFSIDLAIVTERNDGVWERLIRDKTGLWVTDRWFWNEAENSDDLANHVKYIKDNFPWAWSDVRERYLDKKNMYLRRQDVTHHSFTCYIEAVNEVYNRLQNS